MNKQEKEFGKEKNVHFSMLWTNYDKLSGLKHTY